MATLKTSQWGSAVLHEAAKSTQLRERALMSIGTIPESEPTERNATNKSMARDTRKQGKYT